MTSRAEPVPDLDEIFPEMAAADDVTEPQPVIAASDRGLAARLGNHAVVLALVAVVFVVLLVWLVVH